MPTPPPSGPVKESTSVASTAPAPQRASAPPVRAEPAPAVVNYLPWLIAVGALSALLLVAVAMLANTLRTRNTTITQIENRSEQRQAARELLLAQVDVAKVDGEKLKAERVKATTETAQLRIEFDGVKADAANLQTQLDKSRTIANGFQSEMELARVSAIRGLGEVELAKTQMTLLQAQVHQGKADIERLQQQRDDSRRRTDVLQERLTKTDVEITRLKALQR